VLEMSEIAEIKCIYCGNNQEISREHVPPKGLFPPPRTGNLITVPACKICNSGKSGDDEYIKFLFNIGATVQENKAVMKNMDSVMRGVLRKEKHRFFNELTNNMKYIERNTLSGIYVGNVPAIKVDSKKVNNSIDKIIMGLFYHETGKYIYNGYMFNTYWLEYQKNASGIKHLEFFKNVELKVITEDTFSYKHLYFEEPFASVWLLRFYNRYHFVSFIYKANEEVQEPNSK
jgi:hypothetical protein